MERKTANLDFLDRVSVLVIGDVMLDRYLWGDVRRISPEAPVPIVEVERETHTAGGAANVALNLAALGVRSELFGIVGNDANGNELRTLLERNRVAFEPALAQPQVSTITKTRIVAQRQQLCRLDHEQAPSVYSAAASGLLELLAQRVAQHDAVIVSDFAKGLITQAVIDALREVRAKTGVFLALDPKPKRELDIGGFDLLTPNRQEAAQLAGLGDSGSSGPHDYDRLADLVMQRHRPGCLVLTLSEHGMLLRRPERASRHFPTIAHQVADVSGAGDTVVAVLTAAIAARIAPDEAVHLANAAAGIVVGKLGTATVTREELATVVQVGQVIA